MDTTIVGARNIGKTTLTSSIQRLFSDDIIKKFYRCGKNAYKRKATKLSGAEWLTEESELNESNNSFFPRVNFYEIDSEEIENFEFIRYATDLQIFISLPPEGDQVTISKQEMRDTIAFTMAKQFGWTFIEELAKKSVKEEVREKELEEEEIITEFSEEIPDELARIFAKKINVENIFLRPHQLKMYSKELLLKEYKALEHADLWLIKREDSSIHPSPSVTDLKDKLTEQLSFIGLRERGRKSGLYICSEFTNYDKEFRNFLVRIRRILQRGYV